ncbi:10583_t:CDS:10, partial [Funneliformis geosporum]
ENSQWKRNYIPLKDKDFKNANNDKVKSPLKENEKNGLYVVLKNLKNSSNIHKDFLSEWEKYLNFICLADKASIFLFGITQDPKTFNYIVVLEEIKNGNLRSNLMIKKYNPDDKYRNLYFVARSLSALHDCGLVHGDFHSGNLLLWDHKSMYISDFGLSRPADKPNKSNEVYGVLPYIAPEVLRGKPYTIAADIYSFGIIMWEMTSGIPAFNDVPHDYNLALKICRGERPNIIKGTMSEYVGLMEKCWNNDPNNRPTAKVLNSYFNKWYNVYYNSKYVRIHVPENEPTVINHQLSCYISRRFDHSLRLNEELNQDNNDSCLIQLENSSGLTDNLGLTKHPESFNFNENYYSKTGYTENSENCKITENHDTEDYECYRITTGFTKYSDSCKINVEIELTEDLESSNITENGNNKTGLTENMAIDNNIKSQIVAQALMDQETKNAYYWILQCILDATGIASQVFIIDTDPGMDVAIQLKYPSTFSVHYLQTTSRCESVNATFKWLLYNSNSTLIKIFLAIEERLEKERDNENYTKWQSIQQFTQSTTLISSVFINIIDELKAIVTLSIQDIHFNEMELALNYDVKELNLSYIDNENFQDWTFADGFIENQEIRKITFQHLLANCNQACIRSLWDLRNRSFYTFSKFNVELETLFITTNDFSDFLNLTNNFYNKNQQYASLGQQKLYYANV